LAVFCFSSAESADQKTEMNPKKFDYSSYGLVKSNELSVTLHLWRGTSPSSVSSKPKPSPSPGLQAQEKKIQRPNSGRQNPDDILASLEFTNVSARELHVNSGLWFIRLKVFADDKPVEYIGPSVSMPPPEKGDFVTLKPGDKFAPEPVVLSNYFRLADGFGGILKVTFQYSSQVPVTVATLSAGH
jgi:hypothetical protein